MECTTRMLPISGLVRASVAMSLMVVMGACAYVPPRSGQSVGLIERVLAGNIDQRGSEAYNRWGQGLHEGIAASDRKFTVPRK